MPFSVQNQTFTIGEVAGRTGFSKATVRSAIHSGELGALQVNRRVIRVPEPDLARWLERLRARAQRMCIQ